MHVRILASALCGGLLLAGAPMALAATKVDEGFASRHERNGRFARPTNRIAHGTPGQDAYYWIQWRNHPVGRSTLRCMVRFGTDTAPIVDEEITYEDSASEGYSLCGFSPERGRDPEGSYTFTQYLDGAMVGEAVLRIETRFLDRLPASPWMLGAGLLALMIALLAWIGNRYAKRVAAH
jgi:hypothetical protein